MSTFLTVAQQVSGTYAGQHAKSAGNYFSEISHQTHFASIRKQKHDYNIMTGRAGPAWTALDEAQLVNKVWNDLYGESFPGGEGQWNDYDDLNLDALAEKPMRRHELRPFKLEYETYAEIKLRLLNTVISIKGHPFAVARIFYNPPAGFILLVSDGEKVFRVNYNDLQDLRTIPAMYVSGSDGGWLCRVPGKVYQQGLTRHNTMIKSADSSTTLCAFNQSTFMKNFRNRDRREWNETIASLLMGGEIAHMRLSDEVAVKTDRNKIVACYKGRRLGNIEGNDVLVNDEDDLLQDWIERSAKRVGLGLRA